MKLPARLNDEDTRKLAFAADDESPRHLQHEDGSWSLVSDEGWETDAAELDSDARSALGAVCFAPIDVEPISIRDIEVR